MSPALPLPEFSRLVDPRHLTEAPLALVANEAERAALARRFALVRIDRLEASVQLTGKDGTIHADGTLAADIVQSCAISGDDLRAKVREPLALVFVPEESVVTTEEEIELDVDAPDEIPYAGERIDLGEAIAESLALAIHPYAIGPQAEVVRQKHGLSDEGPKGALAAGLAALLAKKD